MWTTETSVLGNGAISRCESTAVSFRVCTSGFPHSSSVPLPAIFFFLKKINWIFCSKWNLLKWIETNPGCAREEREEGKGITQLVLFPLCTSKELGFLQPAHLPYGLLHTVRTVFSGNIYTCMEIYVWSHQGLVRTHFSRSSYFDSWWNKWHKWNCPRWSREQQAVFTISKARKKVIEEA